MSLPRLGHDPREGRDANVSPAIEWIPTLGCWCVFETGAITAILKSADFVAADFAEWHRSLSKMGIDCSSVIEILDYVAIANEGNHHAEIRRNMARVIAAKATSCKEAAGRKVTELVPSLCREGANVDLMREIIRPVCNTLFEHLLGVGVPSDDGISASQIFDLYLSLNRRKEIVSKAGAMLETYTAAQDCLNTAPGYATSLRMLGLRFRSRARLPARSCMNSRMRRASGFATLPIRRLCRKRAFPISSASRRRIERSAMARSNKAIAFVFISILVPSRTMPTTANAISGEVGTPV